MGAGVVAGAGATSFCPAPARAASTAEPICPSSWATTVDTTEFSSTLELEEEEVEAVEAGLEAVCWAGAVPTVVQALHSPTELELKELELSWLEDTEENLPTVLSPSRVPWVDTVMAGPALRVPENSVTRVLAWGAGAAPPRAAAMAVSMGPSSWARIWSTRAEAWSPPPASSTCWGAGAHTATPSSAAHNN